MVSKVLVCSWALVGSLALTGCTSLMRGEQYRFPEPGEPAATIRIADDAGLELHIMNFKESGCYSGWTPVPYKDGFLEAPVAAGKEIILTYHRRVAGMACEIPFSFTPQAGATYTFLTGSWSTPQKGLIPIFNTDKHYCGLGAIRQDGDDKRVEPIRQLRIKTGFACLRFVE